MLFRSTPEDLILVKLASGRERDLTDVSVVLYNLVEKLDWEYLNEEAKKLGIRLRDGLLKSVERLPITVVNPPKVKKQLTRKINDLCNS